MQRNGKAGKCLGCDMFRAGEMPVNRAPCVIALWTSKPQFPSITSGMGDAGCTLDKRAKKRAP